ncbi:MAG: hypothetical protein HY228_01670 [Candidatus Yonathbacteria bacterium]|nr:hypothetical protein [Candidatus Yonathbacteria bacterium]
MDNETLKILEEQASRLPEEVIDFLSSSDWVSILDGIIASSNISSPISNKIKREVVLVLAGLIHPNDFREEIKEQAVGDETTINPIIAEVEEKIFAPIRADLVKFFEEQEEIEKENAEQAESQIPAKDASSRGAVPSKTWEKMPDVAPDNLPVGEEKNEKLKTEEIRGGEISPIPTLIQKTRPGGDESEETAGETHPFEEKMKKVFTGAAISIGELVIETPPPMTKNDPYREPME